ncbi:MAG: FAD-binding oxidoreductase [Gammaproteobacteria bacterium]|nr:FAD-binding oxidoreductase [Gammaproteobacteria bacterium]
MKLESYWLETAPRFAAAPAGRAEGRVDVAVIGGGFTGLAAALALARRGASVALFESTQLGAQASGRNGGQCNGGLAHDYAALAASIGLERTRAYHRAYLASVDSVERIVREESIDCDFARVGRLKLAAKPAHAAALARSCDWLAANVDADYQYLDVRAVRDEVASEAFHGGMLHAPSAQLHPGRLAIGLGAAAARHGARIFEDAPVTALGPLPGGARRVVSARGTVEAAQVLVATGSTEVGPFGWFRRRLAPVGSFIVVTEPLGRARLDALLPKRRNYVTSRIIGNYVRATPDQRLLFGGRARFAMSNPRSDQRSGQVLERALRAAFPQLAGLRLDYCWGGLVDMTIDRLPRAGEHDGLWYAMGYSGHGVQMSVHMGEAMARVMAGEPQANPWRDLDWPAIPGHTGKAWFLPLVGAWYRVQDWLH